MGTTKSQGNVRPDWTAIGWMSLVWAGVLIAFLTYLGVPESLRSLRTPYERQPVFDPSRDPAVGAKPMLPARDVLGRDLAAFVRGSDRVLLAVLGSCDSCSASRVNPASLRRGERDRVILVWLSSEATVRRKAERLPSQFCAIADPKGVLAVQLNAYWMPRYYLLDSSLCVVECQPRGVDLQEWGGWQ